MLDKRLLDRIERVVMRQPLDGSDRPPLALDGEQQAAIHRLAIHQHGAGATLPHVTAQLGARQMQVFAQRVQQRAARLHAKRMGAPVDGQYDRRLLYFG